MKIRSKMISLLALPFAALIVFEIVIQKQVLMPSFAELEREAAATSMTRVVNGLNTELDNLALNAADWGNWADAYRFAQTPNTEFPTTYITVGALKQMQVNTLMIVDRRGRIVADLTRDVETGEPVALDLVKTGELPAEFPWRRNLAEGRGAKGLIMTNHGILMLAAAPILNGTGQGPWTGMVIMGAFLTPRAVGKIGALAQTQLSMLPDPAPGDRESIVDSDGVTRVDRPVLDIYGIPLMKLRVEVPRKITERGQNVVDYASAYLIVAGFVALLLLVLVLDRVVLAPLGRVTRHAVRLADANDLSARLDLRGDDEVAVLGREFDRMVERLADSRHQLADQSFHSGFTELAKGVMHNLGNAMTPLGVRLATLHQRLRDAPVTDLTLAATELAREPVGSARGADLQEFLRLGCAELEQIFKDAEADVRVIQRQAVIVQTALVDLMRSTRNEAVIEAVHLPELVSQTLEIVPDACRQRLIVEADDSLRQVGVVQVARTILRLVLQNLVINAADAVRDAGRTQGVLRVAAEIVRDAGCEQLHLRCEDNGVGIAPESLERVFERGFSTKSRDTNYGIGLHWCANAVGALGGRIWAVSEGPGRGAALHLMLPLSVGSSFSH